jgi:uroporphyrinogen-III decarboxylase
MIDFARKQDLLVAGGWGIGADLLGWVYGLEQMIYAAVDQPEFLSKMLDMIADWNLARMQVILEAGVDLYIRRAWYENCDFWSPRLWKKFIYPNLKAETDLAHQAGAKYGYIITSNSMPLLQSIAEAGVDVIIGVDPHTYDLVASRGILGGRTCLWGGINGHLTVEQGEPEDVRREVRQAMELFANQGGFILSPVDNVREPTPRAFDNVAALIDEWQKAVRPAS